MSEQSAANEFLYTLLGADAALATLIGVDSAGDPRLYPDVAPPEALEPFVTWQLVPLADTLGNGAVRVLSQFLVRVRGVVKGDNLTTLMNIADRIDVVLHDVQGTYQTHFVASARVRPISLAETTGGETFRSQGGEYRLQVHP